MKQMCFQHSKSRYAQTIINPRVGTNDPTRTLVVSDSPCRCRCHHLSTSAFLQYQHSTLLQHFLFSLHYLSASASLRRRSHVIVVSHTPMHSIIRDVMWNGGNSIRLHRPSYGLLSFRVSIFSQLHPSRSPAPGGLTRSPPPSSGSSEGAGRPASRRGCAP